MKNIFLKLTVTVILLWIPILTLNAQKMKEKAKPTSIFPIGDKLSEMFSPYFTGQAYLATLTHSKELNCPISNVTFEPGCRNNWHSHTGGQILIAISGKGYYQAKGETARILLPGDRVEIPPHVVHWHGEAPDDWFSHLAIETNPQTNKNTWLEPVTDEQYLIATAQQNISVRTLTENAFKNYKEMFPQETEKLKTTDPELYAILGNFAFDEVWQHGNLNKKTRVIMILASALGSQALTTYKEILKTALEIGLSPVQIKEILYQSVPYLGISKTQDFINATNEVFTGKGIPLPVESQSTTLPDTRLKKGLEVQKAIFGETIDQMYETSPEEQLHIQKYLSENCFGDYYTRSGLDIQTRELITFSILLSMGGCEPQLKGHIQGNLNIGNNKNILLEIVTQLLPYIGYPHALNAIRCINEINPD